MFNFCFHKYKYVYEERERKFLGETCKKLRKVFRICQKCGKAQEIDWCFICEPFLDWVTLDECEREILLKNIEDCGEYYLLKTKKQDEGENYGKKIP